MKTLDIKLPRSKIFRRLFVCFQGWNFSWSFNFFCPQLTQKLGHSLLLSLQRLKLFSMLQLMPQTLQCFCWRFILKCRNTMIQKLYALLMAFRVWQLNASFGSTMPACCMKWHTRTMQPQNLFEKGQFVIGALYLNSGHVSEEPWTVLVIEDLVCLLA